MAHSTRRSNQRPPTTLGRVEPEFGANLTALHRALVAEGHPQVPASYVTFFRIARRSLVPAEVAAQRASATRRRELERRRVRQAAELAVTDDELRRLGS